MYHLFYYNAYDGLDYYGESTEEELKARLKGDTVGIVRYEKINPNDYLIIKGHEMSEKDIEKIISGDK